MTELIAMIMLAFGLQNQQPTAPIVYMHYASGIEMTYQTPAIHGQFDFWTESEKPEVVFFGLNDLTLIVRNNDRVCLPMEDMPMILHGVARKDEAHEGYGCLTMNMVTEMPNGGVRR
jgi:hypothetical protein